MKPKLKHLNRRILFGITGKSASECISKIKELDALGERRAALFLEMLTPVHRRRVYSALKKSGLKEFPLVHIRNDMKKEELKYLEENYGAKHFTIHESSFAYLGKWQGYHHKLYLELNYDNHVPESVAVELIGGFCIDLSHFKSSEERWTRDFEYVMRHKNKKGRFECNHLNGYSETAKKDIHTVRSLAEFDYLKSLPKFIFGEEIALEVFNPVSEQVLFKKHVVKMLS